MRIIAGTLKHRTVPSPPGSGTRPTSDRGRETLFHVLEHHCDFGSVTVLDLYAGSGALAFEAISRGAQSATLVDISTDVCRHLRATAVALGITNSIRIIRADALEYLRQASPGEFQLIFADPPYAHKSCNSLASLLVTSNTLAADGIVAFEHGDQEHILPHQELTCMKSIEHGSTAFDVFRRVSPIV